MFCYQCEETMNQQACTKVGMCGKKEDTANLQDQLIYLTKVIAARSSGSRQENLFITESLFSTVTNVNFDNHYFKNKIDEGKAFVDISEDELNSHAGVLKEEDEDARSLKELLTYGLKGICAYLYHAHILGSEDEDIFRFMREALAATFENRSTEELTNLVFSCGEYAVKTMALLDEAHTATYGVPEPTSVQTGVRYNPAILISGHDMRDMQELLEQTEGTGVDVYTHGEMLPAHAYPAFKRYSHLVGNYGGSWWRQKEEFERFNGPILMTTNCLVPPKESYRDRLYTTGPVGYEGLAHISAGEGSKKDFTPLIEQAKACAPPEGIENGTVMTGFAHGTVLSMADKVVEAVKSGAIKRFIVMGGCDGRHKERSYYTEFAKGLPADTVILTAGCAKYRYNKLRLGDIGGVPRVLDAGQCNDSYSLVVIAQKLAEAFGAQDINELPISYNIAWYEQKAVAVLLALLSVGVKDIRLGPRLPAFVSPNILQVLQDKFGLAGITDVEEDLRDLIPQ